MALWNELVMLDPRGLTSSVFLAKTMFIFSLVLSKLDLSFFDVLVVVIDRDRRGQRANNI